MGSLGSSSGLVVLFDFDNTIIDCDSDNWVVDNLGATEAFDRLLPTMPWNALMDEMMRLLHSRGKTVAEIADCLREAPLDSNVVAAIKTAFALGCDLRIVSDANVFFINTILEHHGLLGCFTEINTNPGYVDGDGRLNVAPYHALHGCPLCPPNMCKGSIIDRIRREAGPDTRFVYLGDGKGDFCPMLRLHATDFAMPRKDFPVWELIQTSGGCNQDAELDVQAEVHAWSSWAEQSLTLLHLVQKATFSPGVIPINVSTSAAPGSLSKPIPLTSY